MDPGPRAAGCHRVRGPWIRLARTVSTSSKVRKSNSLAMGLATWTITLICSEEDELAFRRGVPAWMIERKG